MATQAEMWRAHVAAEDDRLLDEVATRLTKMLCPSSAMAKAAPRRRLQKNAAGELQYTLSPLYTPGVADGHDHVVDDDTLHKAMLNYSLANDRRVFAQHDTDRPAGEWVEMMRLPGPLDCTLTKADGTSEDVTMPTGTILMGVLWNDDSWPKVKDGTIGGLSMAGTAYDADPAGTLVTKGLEVDPGTQPEVGPQDTGTRPTFSGAPKLPAIRRHPQSKQYQAADRPNSLHGGHEADLSAGRFGILPQPGTSTAIPTRSTTT